MRWNIKLTITAGPQHDPDRLNPFSITIYQSTRPTDDQIIRKAKASWSNQSHYRPRFVRIVYIQRN
jgi:hypothetical protein